MEKTTGNRILVYSAISGLVITIILFSLTLIMQKFGFKNEINNTTQMAIFALKYYCLASSLVYIFLFLKMNEFISSVKNLLRIDKELKMNAYINNMIIQTAVLIFCMETPSKLLSINSYLIISITLINFKLFEKNDAFLRSILKIFFFSIIEILIAIRLNEPGLLKILIKMQFESNLIIFVLGSIIIRKISSNPG